MPQVQPCCIAAKYGMGHSDYCKKSPDYNPNAHPHNTKDSLPSDPFAPSSGKYTTIVHPSPLQLLWSASV